MNPTGLSAVGWQLPASFRQVQRGIVAFQIRQVCTDFQSNINLESPYKNSLPQEDFAMLTLASLRM
jgi:hypothetical protein